MCKCNKPVLSQEQLLWLDEQLSSKDIIFCGIHGSHLYGLDRESSDVDIKAIYLPTFNELLRGESVKTHNKKNDELNIEVEIKSIISFLNSAEGCDTNCMDMLFTPKYMTIKSTPLWDDIKSHCTSLFSKNMKGIIGYIKTHKKNNSPRHIKI